MILGAKQVRPRCRSCDDGEQSEGKQDSPDSRVREANDGGKEAILRSHRPGRGGFSGVLGKLIQCKLICILIPKNWGRRRERRLIPA